MSTKYVLVGHDSEVANYVRKDRPMTLFNPWWRQLTLIDAITHPTGFGPLLDTVLITKDYIPQSLIEIPVTETTTVVQYLKKLTTTCGK